MTKIYYTLSALGFLFLNVESFARSTENFARSAANVIYYHYRVSLHKADVDKYSLFPQEKNIKDFPHPIAKEETDLALLQRYYETVAAAYKEHLEKNIAPKLTTYKGKMMGHYQSIQLTQARSPAGKNPFARSLTKGRGETKGQDRIEQAARTKAVGYYNKTFMTLSTQAADFEKKSEFYKELAETSKELYRGKIY